MSHKRVIIDPQRFEYVYNEHKPYASFLKRLNLMEGISVVSVIALFGFLMVSVDVDYAKWGGALIGLIGVVYAIRSEIKYKEMHRLCKDAVYEIVQYYLESNPDQDVTGEIEIY